MSQTIPAVSVVIPIYNEQENLPELYARLHKVLDGLGQSHEIIFVDDASRDRSRDLIRSLTQQDPSVRGLFFSRNFGHQPAIAAGIDHAQGQAVILMDGDLQDPPEVIPSLMAAWKQGNDVVFAVRKKRKESLPKRLAYLGFYRLLKRLANVDIPLDSGDFSLIDRKVVDLLKKMPERNRFIRGLRSWVGFQQVGVEYERAERHAGEAKYTFSKLLKLAFDGFISFSYLPLRVAFVLGCIAFCISCLLILHTLYSKIFLPETPIGWSSLMIAVTFLGGTQLVLVGLVGEYIGRIYDEVKQRPYYIIGELVGIARDSS